MCLIPTRMGFHYLFPFGRTQAVTINFCNPKLPVKSDLPHLVVQFETLPPFRSAECPNYQPYDANDCQRDKCEQNTPPAFGFFHFVQVGRKRSDALVCIV